MNFRWSNICVLQCLVVLNVNSLKLVPADRTIIKQNGTTRTISRYYLLPHSEGEKQVDIDAEASNEGDFTKFLREFNTKKKVKPKTKQDQKKKTVERYRIYIKRKLKKPKAKVLVKSDVPNSKNKNPNVNSPNKSDVKSDEYVDGYTKIVTKKIPIYKIKTNTTSDESEEEYIIKKKQGELSVAYPKYIIGKKPKKKDGNTEIIEEKDETEDHLHATTQQLEDDNAFQILRSNESAFNVEDSTIDLSVEQDAREMVLQTTKSTTKKGLYGDGRQMNQTKPGDDDYKLSEEPDSLEETNTQNVKQQTQAPDEDSEFQKLLSALHDTPENFPSQVPLVVKDPDSNDYFYKNPLDEKESTNDKSPEDIYEDTKSSQSYNFESNPIPVASYGETIPGSVKTKYLNSSNGRPTNPLENYVQTFHNHNPPFKEPTLNVESIESVSNTTSNESQYEMTNSKYIETNRKPPYAMHKEISDDSEAISNPDFLNYTQKDDKYLGTTTVTLPLSKNQEGTEYSKTARSPISKGYSQESADYLESIKTPQTPKRNQTIVIKIPSYKGYYATSTENSDSIMYPYLSENLTDLDYFGILKKPTYKYKSGYLNLATENTAAVNKSTQGYNQQDIEEKPLPLGYNQTDDEYLNIFKKPYYNPESIEYSEGTKYLTSLGYFQDFENVETASHPPFLSGNQTGFNYPKVIEKPSYIGSNSTNTESRNYNQEGLEYLDTIRNPHILGVNETDDVYPEIIKTPTYIGYGSTITESPSNSQEDLVYLEAIRDPLLLDNNKTDTEYPKNENKLAYESYNTTSTERSETTINPVPLGYNQSDVEYIETTRYPPYVSNYETEVEYSKNIKKPAVIGYQASTEKSDTTINLPPEGYNYGDEYVVTLRNPPSLDNYQEGIQYSKIIKKPTYKEYMTGNTEPSETIKNYELSKGISNSNLPSEGQAEVEYSEHIKHPFYLGYNQASTEYSKTGRSPVYTGINDDAETISEPSHLVFNEESSKYSEKTKSPPNLYGNQGEFEYTKTVRSPPYIGYYQENTEYANTVKSPLAFNQENYEDSEAIKLPPPGYYEPEHPEYTDKPVYLGHNADDPEYSEVINSFYKDYNQSNNDDSGTAMKPLSLDNTGSKYSHIVYNEEAKGYLQTVKNTPYLIYNQASTEYSITIKSPPYIGYYQESTEYKEATNNPLLINYNQGSSKYIEPFKNPFHLSYDQANDEYSETAIYPAIMDNNQASTEYYINAREPPLTVYGHMPNIKHSDNSRFPYGVNHLSQNTEYDENSRIPSYGVHHISQSTEFPKNIKCPPYKVKYPAQSTEYYENSRYPPYGAHQQSQNVENSEYPKLSKLNVHNKMPIHAYSEISRNPAYAISHHALDTECSENANERPYGGPNPRNPPHSVHHKSPSIEYSENSINPPYSVHHKSPGIEYSEISRNPPYATHNQLLSIQYPSNAEYPLYANYQPMQSSGHNENSRNPPYADHGETSSTEYSEISINPPPVISTEHNIFPTVKNIDSSSVVTQIITEQENSTEDIELRDGADYEWSVYKDTQADPHNSRKPKIEIGTNLIQIGTGNEAVNQRPDNNINSANLCPECFKKLSTSVIQQEAAGVKDQASVLQLLQNLFNNNNNIQKDYLHPSPQGPPLQNNQDHSVNQRPDNNINLANLCPECFKKLSTSGIHQEAAGVKDQPSVLQLLQNLFSQLNIQKDYLHPSSQGPPLQNNQDHSIIDFLKKLESHIHPQPIYSNPNKDQNLYKVLELILKGDAETSVGNVKATTIPSIKLFTIENLRKVLEALERSLLTGADKETVNLHKIIKLIFDTALPLTAKTKNGVLWYAQLNSVATNPTQTYVYYLIQQTWLQEIMWQLANNNYNLNVIRNPKWAAYLGAWQLPGKLANTNVQYYDHTEVLLQNAHANGANFYKELSSINIQGDAGAILALLQKYLLYTQLQYGHGSIEYFQKQNEILTRISMFLRERGYPLHFIEALIRKLYAAINANRGQMSAVASPACLAGH